ncbi:MAG: cupin [Candidatus Daviesbacteria bacterium]|nr:MAG: cupin [Candidatus Daviesbacteria bacterium]
MVRFLTGVDRSKFVTAPHCSRVEKPWGYEIIWTPPGLPYVGKRLHVRGGNKISFQFHDEKIETQYLLDGEVVLLLENSQEIIESIIMQRGVGYTNIPGQRHRLIAVTDANILEVSTPETGDTYRLEDDYSRPTETEELRNTPNRGWSV